MTWPRPITVTIGGTNVTADTLDGVRISNGARAWWEQTINSYANITLYDQSPNIAVADTVTVDVDDDLGNPVRLFTGTVSTIDTQLSLAGPFWSVQAVGPLTKAGRTILTDTIPASLDGDQIAALAIDALSTPWLAAVGTWSAQTLTYDQYVVDTSEIDQPGVYSLAAITDTPANILDQLELVASSGQGWLYETPDGTLGYGDSTRRETTPAGDYLVVPGAAVVLDTVLAQQTDADIVNKAIVEWTGGEATVNLTASQGVYGVLERNYETSLNVEQDAIDYATRRVTLDGYARQTLPSGLRVDLRQLSDAELDDLLPIRRNYGIIVEDIPTYLIAEGRFRGFVEGYVWTIGPLSGSLDVYASDYNLSAFGLRWAATGPVAWDDVAATVTWADTEESL